MSKLIKRKDGSYSKRGLWDNIRANKGSGKKPTKEMLKQESKIKKEEKMNSMYKKGGKASKKPMKKESFMEESKELHFGAPGVNPPKKFGMGGPIKATSKMPSSDLPTQSAETRKKIEEAKNATKPTGKTQYEMAGFLKKTLPSDDSDSRSTARVRNNFKGQPKKLVEKTYETIKDEDGLPTGFSNKTKKVTKFVDMYNAEGQKESSPVVTKNKTRKVSDSGVSGDGYAGKTTIHRNGGKSMEPGGGGRFAAMVNKLKSKGKSEEQAEGIAASAGRSKYGKGKFQAMAAAGKKKMMMGGKKC